MEIEDKFEEIKVLLDQIETKLKNKTIHSEEESKKKNSHLHLMIETDVINKMKEKAESQNISLSEWCRQKLIGNPQLDRIEGKLDELTKK